MYNRGYNLCSDLFCDHIEFIIYEITGQMPKNAQTAVTMVRIFFIFIFILVISSLRLGFSRTKYSREKKRYTYLNICLFINLIIGSVR